MEDKGTPRVLLVGHGSFGRLYAEALRHEGMLAGIVVQSKASEERLSGILTEPVGRDLETMVHEQEIDALAVLTPTDCHSAHIRMGFALKKPTMVIKPSTVKAEVSEELLKESLECGVPVMVANEGVFEPPFQALERAFNARAIGAVREIRWLKEGDEALSGNRTKEVEDPATEGRNIGYIYATAMHELYVANRLAGRTAPSSAKVIHVHASASNPELDAELAYPDGIKLRIRYDGRPGRPFKRGLQVVGEKGTLLWLVQPGSTRLEVRTKEGSRDLPFFGRKTKNPAEPVVQAFSELIQKESWELSDIPETLTDGANAIRAARMLAVSAAEHLGIFSDLDVIAGGVDRRTLKGGG